MAKAATPTKSAQAKPAQKRRNTLLTIALVLVILHGIVLALVFWSIEPEASRTLTNISLAVAALAALADVVAGVAMWFWKKWGIYLYAASAIATAIAGLVASGSLLMVFSALLPAIIVLYIVMAQREKFE